jgi:hypothetical protein
VCKEYSKPPIRLCENGHTICNICRYKVTKCPTCRAAFVNTRNLALEDLAAQVMYPCKYRSYGCTETFKHYKIFGHEAICRYSPQVCPVTKLAIGNCSWTGIYSDIKGHLKENHLEVCCEYVEGDFKYICYLNDMKFFRFIFAYNEIFFSLFLEKDSVFYADLQYVGPSENAAKYKYKVEFVNKDDTEGVTVMHLTRSAGDNLNEFYRSSKCAKLHYDVVNRLRDEQGYLKFKLEIIRVGKNAVKRRYR